MPAGIENFALGLVQGMNARKAEQRQNEQDQMRKQEFNLQQEARQFDLTNAKANADNSRVDRERALALQARGDAFNKHFNSAYTLAQSGDEQGAITTLANGFNDPAFGMPYRAAPQTGPDGKLVRDKQGKYVIGYTDPSGKVVSTQSWTVQDALAGFRGINDAAGQYDKLRESQTKASDRAAEKKDKIEIMTEQYNLIDRNNSRSSYRSGSSDGESGESSRTKKNSKYSLDDEIKALFPADAGIVPVVRKQKVQVINNGLTVALQGRDASERARGWNEAYQGFLDVIKNADINRNLTPRQTEEQAMLMFDNHLRKTYGVGYDDAMTQLGLVGPKTLPKKGLAQQPAPAGNSPKAPAQTLVDPVKQRRDAQNAYKQANNFITGGGF